MLDFGQKIRVLKRDPLPGVSYVAVLGNHTEVPMLELARQYIAFLQSQAYTTLIMDYRLGNPVLEPHDYVRFINTVGAEWGRLEHLIYIHADHNLMRTAHVSRLIRDKGVNALTTPSWPAASKALGRDLGEDPLTPHLAVSQASVGKAP